MWNHFLGSILSECLTADHDGKKIDGELSFYLKKYFGEIIFMNSLIFGQKFSL